MSHEDENKKAVPLVKPPLGMPKEGIMRVGRGFSHAEIDKAGATVDDMKIAHLYIDPLRKSSHDANVKTLQEVLGTKGKERATKKPKPKEKEAAKARKGKSKKSSGKK
jgi:ribosomal protein L13E